MKLQTESEVQFPRGSLDSEEKVDHRTQLLREGRRHLFLARVEACCVDEERVQAQPGEFYWGWVTSAIIGPCKGRPGSET